MRASDYAYQKTSWSKLERLSGYAFHLVDQMLTEVLYDHGVEPDKRVAIRKEAIERLTVIVQDVVVQAFRDKVIDPEYVRSTRPKKTNRTIIFDKEDET